ncbi:histidine ammonia-lyase [Acetomicrobium mobile DSM 13181]|uniref:Histidine ammonia-lyase n=1 Tax=Acetomicrobium mobile (strain ATCC BAA-54 / DSM 13181 / JCM 12221 / NGA) TaxID=891968 RepID=I4BVQ2_ACEMN|nr:histidine ammonia-lyase [Acetomicrobium mobile]AFM21359.1 histidine ammonia-lyase [Acetomicrobium mobile DSM 13181]
METIHLNGHSLTLEDVVKVARGGCRVDLDPAAKAFVQRGASIVEKWVEEGRVVYGITTGFGDLASVTIPSEQSETLQENLLKSHASGVGDPFDEAVVRAIMLLRINTLIRGFSGISLETLSLLVDMLNCGIHPVIPSQGSVGASGDLCPLSHLAIALLGLGEVFYKGQRMSAARALEQAGLKPIKLKPKEGLALNNGTAATTAVASLALYDALKLSKVADIAGAMSLEALHGVPYAFDPRTHDLRPHFGQRASASNVRRLIEGSEIIEAFKAARVQDAYSLRCIPQVHGASRDALDFVRQKIDIEINSVTDNPLIFPADGEALSGGNFHAQPIALAMDFLGIAVAEFANISERRVARLVDHKLSGLPAFLMENSGVNSGFMIPQYVCAALVSENKVLAHPSSVDSIPTSAGQEDHVSMGAYAARKARNILSNAQKVIAIEMLAAAQALEFSLPLKPGKGVYMAYQLIREKVPFLEEDAFMAPLVSEVVKLVESGEIINAVEGEIGELD